MTKTSLSHLTWSWSRLLSASGKRSTVFFFTSIFSCFSEFFSSLCFNSSNTYTKKHNSMFFYTFCLYVSLKICFSLLHTHFNIKLHHQMNGRTLEALWGSPCETPRNNYHTETHWQSLFATNSTWTSPDLTDLLASSIHWYIGHFSFFGHALFFKFRELRNLMFQLIKLNGVHLFFSLWGFITNNKQFSLSV